MTPQQTLDELYTRQKIGPIIRKTLVLEAQQRLIEALDSSDLKKADDAIDKLKGVLGDSWNELNALRTGLLTAREKLADAGQEIMGLGGWSSFISNIRSKTGGAISSALTDVFTLVTAVTTGLKEIPTILRGIMIETERGKVSLLDSLQEIEDEAMRKEMMDEPLSALEVGDEKIDIETTRNLFMRALRPEGLMSLVKQVLGGGGIPFVDDEEVANELVRLSINKLIGIAERAQGVEAPIEQEDITTTAKAEEEAGAEKAEEPADAKTEQEERMRWLLGLSDDAKRQVVDRLQRALEG